jgi:hypothetical protein
VRDGEQLNDMHRSFFGMVSVPVRWLYWALHRQRRAPPVDV